MAFPACGKSLAHSPGNGIDRLVEGAGEGVSGNGREDRQSPARFRWVSRAAGITNLLFVSIQYGREGVERPGGRDQNPHA